MPLLSQVPLPHTASASRSVAICSSSQYTPPTPPPRHQPYPPCSRALLPLFHVPCSLSGATCCPVFTCHAAFVPRSAAFVCTVRCSSLSSNWPFHQLALSSPAANAASPHVIVHLAGHHAHALTQFRSVAFISVHTTSTARLVVGDRCGEALC